MVTTFHLNRRRFLLAFGGASVCVRTSRGQLLSNPVDHKIIVGSFGEKALGTRLIARPTVTFSLIDFESLSSHRTIKRLGADNLTALIDTGASHSFISLDLAKKFHLQKIANDLPGSSALGKLSSSSVNAGLYFDHTDITLEGEFLVSQNEMIGCDAVLGMNFLRNFRITIDRKLNRVEMGEKVIWPAATNTTRKEDGFFRPIFSGQTADTFSPAIKILIAAPGDPAPQSIVALIDSGATTCLIDTDLARSLKLPPSSEQILAGASGTSTAPAYSAQITFPTAGRMRVADFATASLRQYGYDVLLGWTVLGNWRLHISRMEELFWIESNPL